MADSPAGPQVCKYIDMPLQHISDPVLRAMNRPPRAHTEALVSGSGLTLRGVRCCLA